MTALKPWGARIEPDTSQSAEPTRPVISMSGDGSFVVIWEGEDSEGATGLWMQIYNADGSTRRSAVEITVGAGDGVKTTPSITMLKNGNFVVAWEDYSGADGDPIAGIRGQIFTSTGDKVGADFRINSVRDGAQAQVSIAALANGGFAVSYADYAGDGDAAGIRTRVFNDLGQALGDGDDPVANKVVIGSQTTPVTIALNNGRYVVLYQDDGGTGGDTADDTIRGHIFEEDGTRVDGDGFFISDATGFEQSAAAVTLADGKFVVTWESRATDDSNPIVKAQVFNADGTKFSDEIIDLTGSSHQQSPRIVALKDGGFAISYWSQSDSEEAVVKLATFTATGAFVSDTAVEASSGYGVMFDTDLSVLGDGRIVLTWVEQDPDTNESGIHAQIFDPRSGGVNLPGTSQNDQYIGTAFNDVLAGAGGNDRLTGAGGNDALIGGAGSDTMIGGAGDDVYYMDAGDVVIEEGGGYDTIIASYSAALGNNTQVEVLRAAAGVAPLSLGGANMNDTLIGNDGGNILDGGAGRDTLIGGRGDDVYYIDADDVVIEEGGGGYDTIIASYNATLGDNTQVEVLQAIAGLAPLSLGGANMNDTLVGNDGHNVINGGSGADRMMGQGGNDIYHVDNASDAVIEASADGGDDHVFTSVNFTLGAFVENVTANTTAAMSLSGNELNNAITGNLGRDTLRGNAGADTLAGGNGNDRLYGGTGKDVFLFDTAGHKTHNKDKILDWKYRDDTIQLDKDFFKKLPKGKLKSKYFTLGDKAKDANDYVGVNKRTGDVWYDKNGDKAGGQVIFANIGKNKAIFASDFFVV